MFSIAMDGLPDAVFFADIPHQAPTALNESAIQCRGRRNFFIPTIAFTKPQILLSPAPPHIRELKEEKNKKVHNDPMSGKISLTKTIHKRGVSYGQ